MLCYLFTVLPWVTNSTSLSITPEMVKSTAPPPWLCKGEIQT